MPEDDRERRQAFEKLQRAWETMKAPHATLTEELADIREWERAYWAWMGHQMAYVKSLVNE